MANCGRRDRNGRNADDEVDWMRIAVSILRAAIGAGACIWLVGGPDAFGMRSSFAQSAPSNPPIWTVPEIGALPNDAYGRLVRRGRDLVTATYAYIGPEVADPAKRYAGNNLACGNCHLQGGDEEVRHCPVRPLRRLPGLQRPLGHGSHARGPPQFLHDPQHERASAAARLAGDGSAGCLREVPVDRSAAGAAPPWARRRQDAGARPRR